VTRSRFLQPPRQAQARARVRSLRGRRRRQEPRAGHDLRGLRQLPDVQPRRALARVREQSRRLAAGRAIEVLNVALWGWSTRQQYIAYERLARAYHPDQVILGVCLNDLAELQNNLSRPPRWLAALHARSALARRIVNAQGREIANVEELFRDPDAARVKRAYQLFFDEVRALREAVQADGAAVVTIEGLATDGKLHAMQEAFWNQHGLQCGFCTPGMIMACKSILDRNPNPTDDEIRHGIEGNLCRCTGYQHIVNSVKAAAAAGAGR